MQIVKIICKTLNKGPGLKSLHLSLPVCLFRWRMQARFARWPLKRNIWAAWFHCLQLQVWILAIIKRERRMCFPAGTEIASIHVNNQLLKTRVSHFGNHEQMLKQQWCLQKGKKNPRNVEKLWHKPDDKKKKLSGCTRSYCNMCWNDTRNSKWE